MPGQRTVDVAPDELDRIQRRAAIRSHLKQEYNRATYNPYRQIHRIELHDPSIERFMAARASRLQYTKPTWKTFLIYFGSIAIPVALFTWLIKTDKKDQERAYRGGLVPYADQPHKALRVPANLHEQL